MQIRVFVGSFARFIFQTFMSKPLFFVLFLILFQTAFGQKLEIELKNFPIELKDPKFYISKVIDSRNDTSKIGWSILNKETKGSFYAFKSGTSNAVAKYLSINLKQDSTQTPLVLNIVSLILTEKNRGMKEGKVRMVVQFLKEENGTYGKVYQTNSFTESNSEFGKDIYTSHERRIRAVINHSLKKLSESKWAEINPDFVSSLELKEEASQLDTLSKLLADTVGLFSGKKKEDLVILKLHQIQFKGSFVPKFTFEEKKFRTLWAFKKHFKQLNDLETNRLYADYKGKFKLTFLAFGIGAALIGASLADETLDDTGLPNLGLAIPGLAFAACSIPIYIKTNKLARKTTKRYNLAIENK